MSDLDRFDTGGTDYFNDIDALISETKQELNMMRGETGGVSDEAQPAAEPQQSEEEFTPDFGNAFDDYGEYETPQDEPAPDEYDEAYDEPYDDYDDANDAAGDEDDDAPPVKPSRRVTRRIVPLVVKILLYVVIVGVIAVGFGYGAWECAEDVLAFGRSDESLTVTVKAGDTYQDIGEMLKERGVIKYPWLFNLYCEFTKSTEKMDPGVYELYYNYDYHALVSGMMTGSPNRSEVRVMIPEGYTSKQIFALMEKNNVCTVEALEKAAAETEFDYWFLEGIPYGESNRLEGFLFPDTYDFYENDEPERVLDKLLTNFNKKFSEEAQNQLALLNERLAERWRSAGYDDEYIASHRFTVYELMTVASMIEKETAGISESGQIASVIYNRLCRPADYPYLNIDATLIYALGGSVEGGLTEADKQVDSPYNTYTHAGLPAGPIANPGLSGITAALNPTDTSYYFYALDKSTGYHHFSESYDEHNQFLASQNDSE